ncbi:MFS transporter [Planctomonas psychrotolerans]|uniref:MFS transporter n=1 Tax=Planctomonas psychrotolerans TaxID=2528712 RepID=UPI001D0D64DE|nr:MFS transporter [Planctomonas psychrotolerans]
MIDGHDLREGTIRTRVAHPWLLLLGIIAIGFLLRGPIIAVAPIVGSISEELDLDASQAGLLTSLPVLCFALVTPLASFLIGRAGANAATTITILGVALGTIVRSSGDTPAVFTGTVLMGVFITIGNVVVPVLIRRDVDPSRVGLVTGLYTSALNVGSMITSIATAPIAEAFGWRTALGTWVAFAVLAAVAWLGAVGPRAAMRWGPIRPAVETGAIETVAVSTRPVDLARTAAQSSTWRSVTAILLALAFAGQSFSYYGMTAWFPQLLSDEQGLSSAAAGSSSSIFQIAAVVGALGIPILASRAGVLPAMITLSALWSTIPLGLIFAPDGWAAWALLGGVAQGGGITLVFMIVVQLAVSDPHARRLSAMVQGVGYALASVAPTAVGAAYEATNGWTSPLLVIAGGIALFAGCGITATVRLRRRNRR